MTKEEIIKKIQEIEFEKAKLIGRYELLEEQEKKNNKEKSEEK